MLHFGLHGTDCHHFDISQNLWPIILCLNDGSYSRSHKRLWCLILCKHLCTWTIMKTDHLELQSSLLKLQNIYQMKSIRLQCQSMMCTFIFIIAALLLYILCSNVNKVCVKFLWWNACLWHVSWKTDALDCSKTTCLTVTGNNIDYICRGLSCIIWHSIEYKDNVSAVDLWTLTSVVLHAGLVCKLL